MPKSENTIQLPDAATLLAWYDQNGRDLPWRRPLGATPATHQMDPYKIWLSEIMLQQTTVVTVRPYFEKFLATWPTVVDFAQAPLDDILAAWAGLGYYARARNMHKCATVIARERNGAFPETEAELLKLPGIGPYTAAAIAAIAFNQRATILDGNVERVMARHFCVEVPLPKSKAELKALADQVTPMDRPGDYAQAIMDLGATICTPRSPSCLICPWHATCQGRLRDPLAYPKKLPKKQKPTRYGLVYWREAPDGQIELERRPDSGLLGGMLGFPGTDWSTDPAAPAAGDKVLPDVVRHTFTHFHLELTVVVQKSQAIEAIFVHQDEILSSGLPTVMRKVAEHVFKNRIQEPDD